MIPPGFIQELLSRVDIVDVVGRHVELKRGGANLMGLCPFHAEKSPSFSVSPSKQFYHCFGCGANGNALRFLVEHQGLSFVEAVRDLAQGAGLTVPEEQVSAQERERRDTLRQRRLSIHEALTRAAQYFAAQLKAQPRAVQYLKQRGLTGQVAARFGLGYAPAGWHNLASVFARYDDPLLEEAGLVRQREAEPAPEITQAVTADTQSSPAGERGRYDWFRNRVMFPIRAASGEVIGFGGRVLDDSKPKYINSPETPVFSKGRELYGLFEARQALRDKGYALVVEGYMDVVALAQNGFANAVATLGTACTAEHVQKLFRFTDQVVFSFDGDTAGRRAAARALEAALPHATDLRSVRFLFLPAEHDPDSYVRTLGAAAFEQQVAQARPLSEQLLNQAAEGQTLNSAEDRARMLTRAQPLWEALPEGALRRQLLPELARRAQLEAADLLALWGTAKQKKEAQAQRSAEIAIATGTIPGLRPPQIARFSERTRPSLRRASRKAPAASADLAVRLLLRHSSWWQHLVPEDHALLHRLGGEHGIVVAWLEQQLMELGTQTWSALDQLMTGQPWQERARQWVNHGSADEVQSVEDLQRVLHRLWCAELREQVAALIAEGSTERMRLDQIAALNGRIRSHLQAEQGLASSTTADPGRG